MGGTAGSALYEESEEGKEGGSSRPGNQLEQAEDGDLLSELPLVLNQGRLRVQLIRMLHAELLVPMEIALVETNQEVIEPLEL